MGVSNFTLENAKIVAMFPSGIYRYLINASCKFQLNRTLFFRQILGYADDKDDKIFHFEYNIVLSTGIASNN